MKILKIVVDERPKECIICMLNTRTNSEICGKMETINTGSWQCIRRVPDERCLIEVKELK